MLRRIEVVVDVTKKIDSSELRQIVEEALEEAPYIAEVRSVDIGNE